MTLSLGLFLLAAAVMICILLSLVRTEEGLEHISVWDIFFGRLFFFGFFYWSMCVLDMWYRPDDNYDPFILIIWVLFTIRFSDFDTLYLKYIYNEDDM
jgi:hypothetical protein